MGYQIVSSPKKVFNAVIQTDWTGHCAKVYEKTTKMRTTFDIFETIAQSSRVQATLGPLSGLLSHGIESVEPFVSHAKILSFTGIFSGVTTLRKEAAHLLAGSADRIGYLFRSLLAVRTVAAATQNFVIGIQEFPYQIVPLEKNSPLHAAAEKTLASVLPVLKQLVKVLSVAILLSHLYEYHQTRSFQSQLAGVQHQKGDLKVNIRIFLESYTARDLSKHFCVPGDLLQEKLKHLLSKRQDKLPEVYALLQNRVQGTQDNKKFVLLGDVLCTATMGLSACNLVGPAAKVVGQANFVWMTGNSFYQAGSANQFLDLIESI